MPKVFEKIFSSNKSLSFKLVALVLFVIGINFSGFSYYLLKQEEKNLLSILKQNGQSLADMLALSSIDALLVHDLPMINTTLNEMGLKNTPIKYVEILENQTPILKYGTFPSDFTNYLEFTSPIIVRGENNSSQWKIGEVRILISKKWMEASIWDIKRKVFFSLFLGFVLLTSLLLWILRKTIISPICSLEAHADAWGKGKLNLRVPTFRHDEIGRLEQAFNSMAENLRKTMISREFVNDILMSTDDMIIVTNSSGNIELMNRAADNFFKTPQKLRNFPLALQESFQNLETEFVGKDGHIIPVLLSKSVVLSGEMKTKNYVFVARNIRELKQAEARIQQQQALLLSNAKMSALGEMAGGMAHEINTPLAILLLQSQLLKRQIIEPSSSTDSLIERLDVMQFSIKRISKIIKGLKSFSRDAQDDPQQLVPLRMISDDTLILCLEKFKNHQIDLSMSEIPENLKIKCRSSEISQVLLNLLNNSFDAIVQQNEKWIKIDLKELEDNIQITITDSGHKIPEHVSKKMMQPFFTTKEAGKGTGLGLSISKGIIESYRGHLEYDNLCPNTAFKVILPRAEKQQVA